MTNIEGAMFPLAVGNKMSYVVKGESTTSSDGWTDRNKCKVQSQERVTVSAGEFDTFKVVCDTEWRKKIMFFSPELNTVVLSRNIHKSKPQKTTGWELVEVPASEG